jgi:hypothetical protein
MGWGRAVRLQTQTHIPTIPTITNSIRIFSNQRINCKLFRYAPGTGTVLKLYPLSWRWWITPMPFSVLIFLYDEIRKLFLRKQTVHGWVGRETYY